MIKRQLDLGFETNETCPLLEASDEAEHGDNDDEVCTPDLMKGIQSLKITGNIAAYQPGCSNRHDRIHHFAF